MSELHSSRRDVMRALAIAPVAIATPGAAKASFADPAATSPGWDTAVAEMNAAERAYDAYCESTYNPAWEATELPRIHEEAELKALLDAVPHRTTETGYKSVSGKIVHLTTASDRQMAFALLRERIPQDFLPLSDDGQFDRCCRELGRLEIERIDRKREIREAFKFSPRPEVPATIAEEHARLMSIYDEAWIAVRTFTPHCVGDLFAKIAMLKEMQIDLDHDDILADLRSAYGEA